MATAYYPGAGGGYFDTKLTFQGNGYDVTSGVRYPGWCIQASINLVFHGQYPNMFTDPFNAALYSSLDPGIPASVQTKSGLPIPWNKINYVLNHKQGTWPSVQLAIWRLAWDINTPTGSMTQAEIDIAQAMVDAANANPSFVPNPGQSAAVILDTTGLNSTSVQNTIIEVTVPSTSTSTPTSTATGVTTGTPTSTATITSTGTVTVTSTITSTGTATATPTITSTGTVTVTSTITPTSTMTVTMTAVPTSTPVGPVINMPTATPTHTPTITPTSTPVVTATSPPIDTPSSTPISSPTDVPSPGDAPPGSSGDNPGRREADPPPSLTIEPTTEAAPQVAEETTPEPTQMAETLSTSPGSEEYTAAAAYATVAAFATAVAEGRTVPTPRLDVFGMVLSPNAYATVVAYQTAIAEGRTVPAPWGNVLGVLLRGTLPRAGSGLFGGEAMLAGLFFAFLGSLLRWIARRGSR